MISSGRLSGPFTGCLEWRQQPEEAYALTSGSYILPHVLHRLFLSQPLPTVTAVTHGGWRLTQGARRVMSGVSGEHGPRATVLRITGSESFINHHSAMMHSDAVTQVKPQGRDDSFLSRGHPNEDRARQGRESESRSRVWITFNIYEP